MKLSLRYNHLSIMVLYHSEIIINVGQMIKSQCLKGKLRMWGYNSKLPLGKDRINS
jgi:hypothetical protein